MKNKYKFLILDIDGTLTNSQKEITPFTRQTLIDVQSQGMQIILASGRPTYGIMPLAEKLELERFNGYILAFNGGKIIDCQRNEVIYEQALPDEVLPKLYQHTTHHGATLLSYHGSKILTEHPENEYVQYAAFLNKMEIQATHDYLNEVPSATNKCLAAGKPEMLLELQEDLSREIGEKVNSYRSEPFFLEIVPKGIDKAASIARLLNVTHSLREETIAFGDGHNDFSMIDFAGLGVAMSNAQPTLKEKADKITCKTNDEDGVAHFLLEELDFY